MKFSTRKIVRSRDPLARFILNCFVVQDQVKQLESSMVDCALEALGAKDEYDIVLTIDGAEIDLEKVIEYWHKRLEDDMDCRALQMLKEKVDSVEMDMQKVLEAATEQLNDLKDSVAGKFGMSYDRYDDTFKFD